MPGLSDILPALHRRSSNIRERLRTISTRSSASSLRANPPASETYQPYSVYHHISSAISSMPVPPVLAVLQEPSAAKHLLEAILESPNGRRALSRLARTCRAWLDPALDVLWRELDSFVPLIGLFPPILLKKTKKPGLGLATLPKERDWDKVLKYGTRVRKITYDEVTTVVSASIFPIFEDLRPRTYILPNLENLTWRISSPENLDRATMFLCPELEGLDLHLGVAKTKFATLPAFLADLGTRMKLKSFSLTGATAIPDAFTNLLQRQDCLERLTLLAPGALSPKAGRWIAYLPRLKRLQLDLSSRSLIPVNGFFDQIRSGDATPDSLESHTDSGVFSADEADFAEVRKAALRITEDARVSSGAFGSLTQLHLTGSVGNIAAFLGHLNCALAQLELVIEDPPDAAEWRQLCGMFGDRFGDSLVSLNISATLSSKFSELVRSTSRAAPAPSRLNLEHLSSLPFLRYLSIDLPESILFTATDVARLSEVAPSLQDLRLSPLARFTSTTPPQLTLDALAPLVRNCPRLASLAVVINANVGSADITATSEVLRWLHVGHSWVSDSLQVAILLSQFAPNLEAVKWYTERNRPGFNEANSRGWQQVAEILPHLQQLRRNERKAAMQFRPPPIILPPPPPIIEKEMVIEYVEVAAPRPVMADKSIDATVSTAECGIEARPAMADMSVQAVPTMSSRQVQAVQKYASISVDATPEMKEIQVDATVTPTRSSAGVQTTVKTPDELASSPTRPSCAPSAGTHSLSLSSILSLVGMLRTMMLYPFTLPLRIVSSAVELVKRKPRTEEGGDVALDTLNETVSETETEIRPEPVQVVERWVPVLRRRERDNQRATRTSFVQTTMSDNKKQERDFTPEVDALIAECDSLVKSGKLEPALDKLLILEKQTRNAADLKSTTRLVKAVAEHCYQARNFDLLNTNVSVLSKKHGQLKAAVQALVELVMTWLDDVKKSAGTDKWIELLNTLRSVTEGKIYLETPRARVTLTLAKHHEVLANAAPKTPAYKENMQTASELLSDLQVETYSSMDRREKTEFILEQMRLLVAVARLKDAEIDAKTGKEVVAGGEAEWIKVRVGGRKINEEFLKEKENEDLKLKYYDLMIQHALHGSAYLDVAKYYHKVWETPSIKEDVGDQGKAALEHIVYYIVLASHSNEQSDMLHRLYTDPALLKLELHYNLVKCFVTRELMRWPGIVSLYGEFLRKTPVFSREKQWEDLHTRVIEHNVRVVEQYYTRITLTRLTSLLDLDQKQTEETISRLVVAGTIWARIDRPAGIVSFRSAQTAEDVMNAWSSDMQKLLSVVEKSWMSMNAAQAAIKA